MNFSTFASNNFQKLFQTTAEETRRVETAGTVVAPKNCCNMSHLDDSMGNILNQVLLKAMKQT